MSIFTSKRSFLLLLAACAVTGAVWAAQDPFVGEWKLSRSNLVSRMKVESLGGNKYAFYFRDEFDFGGALCFGGGAERIVADGTDQRGNYETMLSVTVEGPDTWKVVRKRKDGRMLCNVTWKLSQDGNTLRLNNTEYKRTGAGPGFAGSWESTTVYSNGPTSLMLIRPYDENGLSFIPFSGRPSVQGLMILSPEITTHVKFDGKDYPNSRGVQGSTSSARRVDERILKITDKIKGKIMRTEQLELSPSLKTLTMTVRPVGQREPNILVFERR